MLLALLGFTAAPQGGVSFAPARHYATGSSMGPGPGAVTTLAADVDGDGDIDVVVTDWFGDGPFVMKNNGRGGFGAPRVIEGAGDLGALAAGDLNGDGHVDLVGRDGSGVVVLVNRGNGTGTFRIGERHAVAGNAQQSVAVADVDGDGHLDVITAARQGVQILLGRGDGRLRVGPLSPLLGLLSDVQPADLDGDGIPDLVVADATPLLQRVVALRGVGDGRFVETGGGSVGFGPEAVLPVDLDGDGLDDAVSIDSFSIFGTPPVFTVSVLRNDGRGGFLPATSYATGHGPVSGAVGDVNGDGRPDVVVSAVGDSSLWVYLGDGRGGLVPAAQLPVTRQPQTPVVADLDGDGRADLAVPGVGSLSVLRNTTA